MYPAEGSTGRAKDVLELRNASVSRAGKDQGGTKRGGRRWAAPQEWTEIQSGEERGGNENEAKEVKLP